MKVIILAAGYATRLYPLTKNRAKPLLPVKGIPIINYIMKRVEPVEEVDKVYVVTNDKFYNDFKLWRETYKLKKEIKIINDQTLEDETKLGAIGDINFVINNEKIEDDILIVAGDNLFNFNLEDFVKSASSLRPAASLGIFDVKEKELAKLYGVVTLDEKKQIIDFQEKPQQPQSTLAAVGIYFIPKEIMHLISRYLKEDNTSDQPGYFISWLFKIIKVHGFSLPGEWFDIGNIESYQRANGAWKEEI